MDIHTNKTENQFLFARIYMEELHKKMYGIYTAFLKLYFFSL